MIESIKQTDQGFIATVDGVVMTIPAAPGNRHWKMVQEAIAEGANVLTEQAPRAPIPDLTFAQLLIGLVAEGWITEAQGEAWLDGQLPAQFDALIARLPAQARFAAKARAKRPSVVLRDDGIVTALAAAEGKTPAEIDAFFVKYAGI